MDRKWKNYEEYKKTKNIKSVFDTSVPKNIKVSTSMEEVLSNTDLIYIITASKYVDLVTKKWKIITKIIFLYV